MIVDVYLFRQRFNNFMQILRCICDILAAFFEGFRAAAAIVRLIAKIVYLWYAKDVTYAHSACLLAVA